MQYIVEYHQHRYDIEAHVLIKSPRGDIYMLNNLGPNTEPCDTPYFKTTFCFRLVKYDHLNLRSGGIFYTFEIGSLQH